MWILILIIVVFVALYIVNRNKSQVSSDVNPRMNTTHSYTYNIVGEESYQSNIAKIAGKKEIHSKFFEIPAKVISEPNNKFDPNAIKVEINGYTVGYLPKDEARKLSGKKIKKVVPAVINGGWHDEKSEGSYGVKLAISTVNDLL